MSNIIDKCIKTLEENSTACVIGLITPNEIILSFGGDKVGQADLVEIIAYAGSDEK